MRGNRVIFLVKGYSRVGTVDFSRRLTRALNPAPPAWPVDQDMLRDWQHQLRGWPESDPAFFLDTWHVNVDRVVALVLWEHRHEYPAPPRWSRTTPRRDFERWRDTSCLDVLQKRLPRVFDVVCDLIDSLPHPVIDGSELGTTPRDSLLTRMIGFKYSKVPTLKILLEMPYEGFEMTPEEVEARRTATVLGKKYRPAELLEKIRLRDDGSVGLDPDLPAAGERKAS